MAPFGEPERQGRHAGRPRIVFVVMSAVAPAATVEQLARALAPHTVLVHHDFSQAPEFRLASPNVAFVPEPRRTGWGVWGFTDGIFHALRHALAQHDFDYLQLLSPSCLPIKPLARFEAHVQEPADAHFECVDLLADRDAMMSVGYRAFTPEHSWRHRVLRRLSREYFGEAWGRRDEAGIWLRSGGRDGPLAWLALGATRALSLPRLGRHPFDASFHPYYGSVWFGARRHVVASLLDGFDRQGVREYFCRLRIAEEFLVPSLLMQARPARGPLNHYIQRFDEAHPGKLVEEHLDTLRASPAFFARKFPNDAEARVRVRVLEELCHPAAPQASAAPAEPAAPSAAAADSAAPVLRPTRPLGGSAPMGGGVVGRA